ncbi:hypothetical protein ACFL1E_04870 [Candidatus Omnitrophota bacterium]
MKKLLYVMVIMSMSLSMMLMACGEPAAKTSQEAINASRNMQTTEQRAEYLIKQAQALYSSKKFQDAVDVAQYILQYVDKDSQAAKDLIEKAREALTAQAQKVMDDAKAKIPGLGN